MTKKRLSKALVSFLEAQEFRRLATVSAYKKGATIRKSSDISISCKVKGYKVTAFWLPVIFEPNSGFSLDDGLVINESILRTLFLASVVDINNVRSII